MALSKHWKEGRYGFHYLVLTQSIQPCVYYEHGYVASVFGNKLSSSYETLDNAKAAVEAAVFRVLDSALARLNDKSTGAKLAQSPKAENQEQA